MRYTNSFVVLLLILVCQAGAQKLRVGSSAPRALPKQFIQGEAFDKFEKGQIYVIEFWATWCGPCIEAMPHLSQLSKKYAGKAKFVGINVLDWESGEKTTGNTNHLNRMKEFLNGPGKAMEYSVAIDDPKETINSNWLVASERGGIPCSFVVKDNRIQWIGHPLELEPVLNALANGTYDLAAAIKEYEDTLKQRKLAKKARKDRDDTVKKAAKAKDLAQFLKAIQAFKAKEDGQNVELGIQAITQDYPEFCVFVLESLTDKPNSPSRAAIAQMTSFIVKSAKDRSVQDRALKLCLNAVEAEPEKTRLFCQGMYARALAWGGRKEESHKALDKLKELANALPEADRGPASNYVNSIEKMIKSWETDGPKG